MFASYDWIGISSVITAVGVIVIAIVVPVVNSRRKSKEMELEFRLKNQDREIERRFECTQKELTLREKQHNLQIQNIYSHLYGYVWNLLYKIDADRVSIVQPHPENDRQYISVSFEAIHHSRDVSTQKENFQRRPILEWGDVIQVWMRNDFIMYNDVSEIKQLKLYAEAFRRGILTSAFCRIAKVNDYWIATLVADFGHDRPKDLKFVETEMKRIAPLIADILPEYHELKAQ